jgi:hypothetical protein
MSTTYNWSISALDTAPSEGALSDVVKTVHWRFRANNGTHDAEVYGTVSLEGPTSESFTAFNSLTKTQVESWLESKLNKEELMSSLDMQLERLANPPIVSKSVPWV